MSRAAAWRSLCELWVSRALGMLLLTSGILKLASFYPSFSGVPDRVAQSRWHAAALLCELLLAIWLLSGIARKWSLAVAAGTFLCFALATLRMIHDGVGDCGCFGAASLSPKVTFWIDVAALSAAIGTLPPFPSRFAAMAAVPLAGLACYLGAVATAPHIQADPGIRVGHAWPPSGVVACSEDLSKGRWVVLIHDRSCHRCAALGDSLAGDAASWASSGTSCRLALIDESDTPDFSDPSSSSLPASPKTPDAIMGRLLHPIAPHHAPILLLLPGWHRAGLGGDFGG